MSNCNLRSDSTDVKLGLAAEILRARSPLHVRAWGTSMLPSLWPGDVLIIESCEPEEIGVGDIIRFLQAGHFVIHRVIAVASDGGSISWITRGDSVKHEDAPVCQANLLGRVTAIHRNGRMFPPARRLSRTAHAVGRKLQTLASLQGLVRNRFFSRRPRHSGSGLVKA